MRICECGRKENAFWINKDGKFRCYYCTFKISEEEEERELNKKFEEEEEEENEAEKNNSSPLPY